MADPNVQRHVTHSLRRITGDGYIYARSVHTFLTSRPGDVDLREHRLIVVGHSFGGNAAYASTHHLSYGVAALTHLQHLAPKHDAAYRACVCHPHGRHYRRSVKGARLHGCHLDSDRVVEARRMEEPRRRAQVAVYDSRIQDLGSECSPGICCAFLTSAVRRGRDFSTAEYTAVTEALTHGASRLEVSPSLQVHWRHLGMQEEL